MKRKFYFTLAFVLASICSLHMQAERVAPTLPQGQTPENGKCYWLYNVTANMFLGTESSTSAIMSNDGNDLFLVQSGNYWNLRRYSAEGYYLYSQSINRSGFAISPSDTYKSFVISQNGENYRLATKEYESSNLYLGYKVDNNYVYGNYQENVDWLFMDAAEAAHYSAELKLYNALNATDGKGWFIDQFETMYTNRATATNLEMTQAAEQLTQAVKNSTYSGIFDPLNEYDMMLYYGGAYSSTFYSNYLSMNVKDGTSAYLTATVETNQNADLYYTITGGSSWMSVKVYIDEELVRTINENVLDRLKDTEDKFFDKISAGKHIIRWEFSNVRSNTNSWETSYIRKIGITNTPLITVNLAEPGSLGTEVLYNVNHVRDVRNLKIIGEMNAADAERLSMMTNIMYLDMSEAKLAQLPKQTFTYEKTPYLHSVILPEGMTSIGEWAFRYSNIENIVLPSTVKSIGNYAFESTMLKSVNIPDATTSLGSSAFYNCYQLEDVHYSNSLTTIPSDCFNNNILLKTFEIPEGITEIESRAFGGCKYGDFQPVLPLSLKTIGDYAFSGCNKMKEIIIKDNVTSIGDYAFNSCTSLEKAVVSQQIFILNQSPIFAACSKLKDLTMRSATLVKLDASYHNITNDNYRPNITLRVPQHLVNFYKLDPYWYNFGDIVGFSTEETKDWTVHTDLTLDSHSRFEGEPNISLAQAKLKIVGDLPMAVDNFTTNTAWYSHYAVNMTSQVMSGCDNINVLGNCFHNVTMYGGRWLCMTLPFDTKLGNIVPVTDDVLFSVRYYDGAERAANGVGGSWKRITDSEQVIPAGTGFIIQNSASWSNNAIVQFKSLENESRNNILNNKDFEKTLEINACAEKANSGWNLIGNPYLTYYNIHKLNFTAPITVYDYDKDAYYAYSITDDDYALKPLQGFFVQCPGEEMNTISFPVSGKQFTSEITEQNAVKARVAEQNSRKLIDLTLSMGDVKDNTRIVFNEDASCEYEINCDASKFMSGNKKNIQLWTLDDKGTAYAINERPMVDGVVALGVTIPSSGTYTFAATRCQAEGIVLHDNETGIDTDLTQSEYTFEGSEGTFANRFEIRTISADATGIENIADSNIDGVKVIYTVDGRLVKKADKSFNEQSLPQGAYIIKTNGATKKIIINK